MSNESGLSTPLALGILFEFEFEKSRWSNKQDEDEECPFEQKSFFIKTHFKVIHTRSPIFVFTAILHHVKTPQLYNHEILSSKIFEQRYRFKYLAIQDLIYKFHNIQPALDHSSFTA
jgi:hypothetical protein